MLLTPLNQEPLLWNFSSTRFLTIKTQNITENFLVHHATLSLIDKLIYFIKKNLPIFLAISDRFLKIFLPVLFRLKYR
jgi:hypothetical protein